MLFILVYLLVVQQNLTNPIKKFLPMWKRTSFSSLFGGEKCEFVKIKYEVGYFANGVLGALVAGGEV